VVKLKHHDEVRFAKLKLADLLYVATLAARSGRSADVRHLRHAAGQAGNPAKG
jgi:hypothetical protein